MHIPLALAIPLLHQVPYGTLATHSTHTPGYPYASLLPFVADPGHRPLLLLSELAEHTKNLHADPRASLLLAQPHGDDVLSGARLTVLGDVTRIEPDAALVARYLRYQPDAERYLALGDFGFYRLEPQRLRLIAGFGKMGWIEADSWHQAAQLAPQQEQALLDALQPDTAAHILGLDCYGLDIVHAGQRLRLEWPATPPAQLEQAALAALAAL